MTAAKKKSTGFTSFLHQYNVIPLAIGVVIGTAVNDLVKVLVGSLFTPLVSLLTPKGLLQDLELTVPGTDATFAIGAAVNGLIGFLIVFFLVYLFAKYVLRNEELLEKK